MTTPKPRGHRYTLAPLALTWTTLLLAWTALSTDPPDWLVRLAGALVVAASLWMAVWLSRSWKGLPVTEPNTEAAMTAAIATVAMKLNADAAELYLKNAMFHHTMKALAICGLLAEPSELRARTPPHCAPAGSDTCPTCAAADGR